jgi:hypothetical protein
MSEDYKSGQRADGSVLRAEEIWLQKKIVHVMGWVIYSFPLLIIVLIKISLINCYIYIFITAIIMFNNNKIKTRNWVPHAFYFNGSLSFLTKNDSPCHCSNGCNSEVAVKAVSTDSQSVSEWQ